VRSQVYINKKYVLRNTAKNQERFWQGVLGW